MLDYASSVICNTLVIYTSCLWKIVEGNQNVSHVTVMSLFIDISDRKREISHLKCIILQYIYLYFVQQQTSKQTYQNYASSEE